MIKGDEIGVGFPMTELERMSREKERRWVRDHYEPLRAQLEREEMRKRTSVDGDFQDYERARKVEEAERMKELAEAVERERKSLGAAAPSMPSDWRQGAARNMNVPLEPRTVDTLLERALKELARSQDWLERIEERLGLGSVANNAREVDGGPFMNLVDAVTDRSADVASRIEAVARRLFYGVGDE